MAFEGIIGIRGDIVSFKGIISIISDIVSFEAAMATRAFGFTLLAMSLLLVVDADVIKIWGGCNT